MKEISSRPILRRIIPAKISLHVLFALMLAFIIPVRTAAQDYYPVHATVQVLPPYSLYLSDYSNGFRDRLVITLYNRDLQQQTLDCRLRLRISNTSGFCIESRDEVPQRSITVEPNVPLRLTSQDIAPYLQPGSVKQTGTLRNGRLPEGMMTFSVQVVEQHTGRILSPWASGRAWLETKKPPMLVMPEKDETVAFADPQHILFRWYPQHLGLSGVEYELHIRKMPDYCQNPAAQYDSGVEVFTTKTRQTLYNYSNIDPELIPGHTYAWRVRAVAMDGIDEVGVFDNDGYSETGWFRLVRGCDAPVIDRAEAGYRKLDLGWHGSAGDMRYTVQYCADKENGSYNWKDTTTIDNETTLYGLTPGATYSYRVGALCSATGKPVYSQIGTVQIPNRDSISAANCGVAPVYKELSKERKTDLKVGDRVTVGGDYTMLITELNSKGNGVYGGKGRLTFTWVFFVGLEVTFDDLVVNTDGYQIDGTVNTVYDGTNTNIANLDQLNDGGVNNRESRMSADGRSTLMNFSVPPMPRSDLSEDGGSVVVYDLSGAPHTIEIPKNAGGGQSIPFSLTDIDGNTWRFESCDSVVTDSLTGNQKTVHGIRMTKLDAVSGFSKDKLSDKVKARIAFMNGGQYAFDNLSGRYYSRSSKLGKDYLDKSGLGDGTYAPWKLVPMGKSDKIKAGLNPTKIDIDIASVRFVDADGHDLESSYDSDNAVWTVSLTAAATEGNYYNVYAVAKPKDGKGSYQTIGKLFVVSYKTTKADIVLLPVEKHNSDISELGKQVSDIFAPCGVEISITESDALVGNTGWDLNGDGKLSLTNDAETDNVKRSAEMKALEDIVKSMPGYDKNALYLVYVPNGSKSSGADVEGNWGRGRQIGYVFEKLDARTVAHEVGHAFTLQHTFEKQYGGNETRCKTENLMDYTKGTQLDAFQWEILAHNAPKIVASVVDGAEDNWIVENVGKVTDDVARGLTPDGKVIVSVQANPDENKACKIVFSISEKSDRVWGFFVYSPDGQVQNYYEWSAKDACYVSTKYRTKIDDAKDIVITYYDCSKVSNPIVEKVKIFRYHQGDSCFYKVANVSYNASTKLIKTKNPNFKTGLLFTASKSCADFLIDNGSRFGGCTEEKIKFDSICLPKIQQSKNLDEIVEFIDSCCIEVLNNEKLSYDQKVKWIDQIVNKISLWSLKHKLAVVRLMTVIRKPEDCKKFSQWLVKDSNKQLYNLIGAFSSGVITDRYTTLFNDKLGKIFRRLPWEDKANLFTGVVEHDKLTEGYECAILTLMDFLSVDEYSRFYKLLEDNNNKLIRKIVKGIHDVGILGTGDNYTKLIAKLCEMYKSAPKSWEERFPESISLEDLFKRSLNLSAEPFVGSTDESYSSLFVNLTDLHKCRYNSSYDENTGMTKIWREKALLVMSNSPSGGVVYSEVWEKDNTFQSEYYGDGISPMTPILISIKDKLPLVATALGDGVEDTTDCYIVPAIALQFIKQKEFNHNVEVAAMVTLDVVTIGYGAPVAFASKIMWLRRAWAFIEMAGAAGDIAVNVSSGMDENCQTAINAYNAVLGVIGLQNVIGSSRKLFNLCEHLKTADFKKSIADNYKTFKTAIERLRNYKAWEKLSFKNKLENQEKFFDVLYNYLEGGKTVDGAKPIKAADTAEDVAKSKGGANAKNKKLSRAESFCQKNPEFAKAFDGHKAAKTFYNRLKDKNKIKNFEDIFIKQGCLDVVDALFDKERDVIHQILECSIDKKVIHGEIVESCKDFVKSFSNENYELAVEHIKDIPEYEKIFGSVPKIKRSERVQEFLRNVENGRKFGNNVVDKIKAGGELLQKLAAKTGIDIEELKQYQVFTEVPLETTNGFMKADVVLLKVSKDGEDILDAIVIENKLSQGTAFTARQKEGFGAILASGNEGLEMTVKYSPTGQNYNIKKYKRIRVKKENIYKISDHGEATNDVNRIDIVSITTIK